MSKHSTGLIKSIAWVEHQRLVFRFWSCVILNRVWPSTPGACSEGSDPEIQLESSLPLLSAYLILYPHDTTNITLPKPPKIHLRIIISLGVFFSWHWTPDYVSRTNPWISSAINRLNFCSTRICIYICCVSPLVKLVAPQIYN